MPPLILLAFVMHCASLAVLHLILIFIFEPSVVLCSLYLILYSL